MATVKAKIKNPSPNGFGRVYYQIIHKRVVCRILTEIWTLKSDLYINSSVAYELKLIENIIASLDKSRIDYTSHDVVSSFYANRDRNTFEKYFDSVVKRLEQEGRFGGKKTYKSSLASFREFSAGIEHLPCEITGELMAKYQAWLAAKGLMENTISFYMRHMRAVYKMMVREGLTYDAKPFANIFTGIARTRKRAITEGELKKIKNVDLSQSHKLSFARDLFLLSFYCMGMPFVDIVFLKKSEIKGGRITYSRKKTGQTISIMINSKIQKILDRYKSEPNSPFVLPLITRPGENERTQYENALRYTNGHLKKIAELAMVKSNISTYTPRHTWASIAKLRHVQLSTIKDALGHENESTTQIYLATLDNSHVDRANELIIKGF